MIASKDMLHISFECFSHASMKQKNLTQKSVVSVGYVNGYTS